MDKKKFIFCTNSNILNIAECSVIHETKNGYKLLPHSVEVAGTKIFEVSTLDDIEKYLPMFRELFDSTIGIKAISPADVGYRLIPYDVTIDIIELNYI